MQLILDAPRIRIERYLARSQCGCESSKLFCDNHGIKDDGTKKVEGRELVCDGSENESYRNRGAWDAWECDLPIS